MVKKIWLKSYTPEIESIVEDYYHRAFRRKIPDCVDSITLLPKKEFEAKCIEAGLRLPLHEIVAFLDYDTNSGAVSYQIYSKFGRFDDVVNNIGHEMFHLYLGQQVMAGKVDSKRLEDYVIDEAFAHLGSRYFHDMLYKEDALREKYSVGEFDLSLPRAKEHRRAYKLTNTLVEKFYPRYFTPVKRLLIEASIDEIVKVSGLHRRKLLKK